MTVYAIAQITITDRAAYQRYQSRFVEVLKKHPGRLLVAQEDPAVVEGRWDHQKIIIIAFPDEDAFQAWAQSPEYLEIAADRKAGSHGVVLLANSVSPTAEAFEPVF